MTFGWNMKFHDKPIQVMTDPDVYPNGLTKGSEYSAGYDLRSLDSFALSPGQREFIQTGVSVHLLDHGLTGLVSMRSSVGAKGLILLNAPGVIDADYTGEIKLAVQNISNWSVAVDKGDRVAQLVLIPNIYTTLEYVERLPHTGRGSGGFGSSGRD